MAIATVTVTDLSPAWGWCVSPHGTVAPLVSRRGEGAGGSSCASPAPQDLGGAVAAAHHGGYPLRAAACPSTTIIASGLKCRALSLLGCTLGIVCS